MNHINEYQIINHSGEVEPKTFDKVYQSEHSWRSSAIRTMPDGITPKYFRRNNDMVWWVNTKGNNYNAGENAWDPFDNAFFGTNLLCGVLGNGDEAAGLDPQQTNHTGIQLSRVGRCVTPIAMTIKIQLCAAMQLTYRKSTDSPILNIDISSNHGETFPLWEPYPDDPAIEKWDFIRTTFKVCVVKDHKTYRYRGSGVANLSWTDVFEDPTTTGVTKKGAGCAGPLANQRIDNMSEFEVLFEEVINLTGAGPQELLTFNLTQSQLPIVGYKEGPEGVLSQLTTYGIYVIWTATTQGVQYPLIKPDLAPPIQLGNPIVTSRMYYFDA